MTLRNRYPGLILVAALAVAAAPVEPQSWERLGNEAFAAGRFDEAARCYAAAGERSQEPGRVAHNHAVTLFNIGRYRDAERMFRCELESAQGLPRRARALYDLGTCLLHAAEGRDAHRLSEAIDYLQRCARITASEESLRSDARFNLELAKQQWRRIRTDEPPPAERDPSANDDEQPRNTSERPGGAEPNDQPGGARPSGTPRTERQPGGSNDAQPSSDKPPPGAGSMPPISDEEQLKPLPPHEARELLRQAGERIARERRALQRANAGAEPHTFPDW